MSLPRLRAPKEHGQILAVPSLDEASALLERNQRGRRSFNTSELYAGCKSLNEVRELARREILAAATQYHFEAGQPVPHQNNDLWLVAGHQPELFHPGVWFKNFALNQLACRHGATSLNLVIDTDTAKPAFMHAPAEGRLARVAFDRTLAELPYEERVVEEESIFAELPERMRPIVERWNFEPMLDSFWREVMLQARRTRLLGERLAAARRAVERRWGVVQREIPMSRVCRTKAFAWFVGWILAHLSSFHAIYNETVDEYRRTHGIRSRSHPVPDLAIDGDWLESPFWAWRQGEARRGKLFLRTTPTTWMLRIGNADALTISPDSVAELEIQGFKIRPRALTTTMFARLFIADLFIHGIGGAVYDELTDRIIERFFNVPAPAFLVASATLLLPLPRHPAVTQQARDLERRMRDLVYRPERFIESQPDTDLLLQTKREWIGRAGATHAERVERFQRIREINASLLPLVQHQLVQTQRSLEEARRQIEWDAVAGRRDYAFCLYPEEMLRTFFQTQQVSIGTA